MFEAVFALCVSLETGPCRDQLLPGYEAADIAGCEAALSARPPELPDLAKGSARCQPIGKTLEVNEVALGVFAHRGAIAEPDGQNRGDVSNLGFVIGDNSVAVIDTGGALWVGESLWRAIRVETDLPVTHVILTHMHPDHVFGASVFAEAGAVIVGHEKLPRALADRQANYIESLTRLVGMPDFIGTVPVLPSELVQDRTTIDLGGRVLELRAWPTAHTGNDLTVLDLGTGTLFTGDLIFDQHTPALDGKLTGWQAVLVEMAEMGVARVVPGHGGPVLDWPDGAAPMKRYLQVLEKDTRAAINSGQRMGEAVEEIAASEAEHWELFDAYNPRNATVAYTELEWE